MLSVSQTLSIRRKLEKSNNDELISSLDALSDRTRFEIFKLLAENRELCVTDIARILEITIPAVSQHLRILEMNSLVRKERMGQMMCYEIKRENHFVKLIIKLLLNYDQ